MHKRSEEGIVQKMDKMEKSYEEKIKIYVDRITILESENRRLNSERQI